VPACHGFLLAVSTTAILFTVSGTQTRRWWSGTRGKSLLLSLASAGMIALEAFVLVPRLVVFSSVYQADRPAPSFTLAALDGGTVRSSELRGPRRGARLLGHLVLALPLGAARDRDCLPAIPE
jgi:hypothetical protein